MANDINETMDAAKRKAKKEDEKRKREILGLAEKEEPRVKVTHEKLPPTQPPDEK